MSCPLAIDQELVGVLDDAAGTIAGYIPHDHFFTFSDLVALKLCVTGGRAAHVGEWCLPANDLRDHIRNKAGILA